MLTKGNEFSKEFVLKIVIVSKLKVSLENLHFWFTYRNFPSKVKLIEFPFLMSTLFDLYYDNVYKNCISSRRRVYGVAKKQVIFGFVKLKGSDDDGICPIYYHVTIE